jgi:hypothetical protein
MMLPGSDFSKKKQTNKQTNKQKNKNKSKQNKKPYTQKTTLTNFTSF